ncbi:hypothetical protein BDV93DRAFT_541064 [Ceratobasidium sp. AG-I]|nr:hypothetical protein BDV93DRAFT_541064 [Ceratobasidium sp. AG-I]
MHEPSPTKPEHNMTTLTAVNPSPQDAPTVSSSGTVTIHAIPGRDLWRKSPSITFTNAPAYVEYRPISQFRRARVTIHANWGRLYDQGGLVLYLPQSGSSTSTQSSNGLPSYESWVKTGIEMVDVPKVGTVTTPPQGFSDWSLVSTLPGTTSATIEVARENNDGLGPSLYVYIVNGEEKTLIRETTWVFKDADQNEGLLGVGVYAARAVKVDGEAEGDAFPVHFKDLQIEWADKQ